MTKLAPFVITCLVILLSVSCAGGPDVTIPVSEALSVTLSTEAEIKGAYGFTYATNPFLPAPGLFSAGKTSLLVVRFETKTPLSLDIAGVELVTPEGKLKTRLMGKEELTLFWETKSVDDGTQTTDANNQKRFASIDRYALDLYKPNSLRKKSPYSLVIQGPAEEDIGTADLVVRYYVNGEYRESMFLVRFESTRK